MSTASRSGRFDEASFVVGVVGGTLVFTLGAVLAILGLSVGVRDPAFVPSGELRALAAVAGVAIAAAGVGVRGATDRVGTGWVRTAVRVAGHASTVAGLTVSLLAFSAVRTFSAPFLLSLRQKVVLVVVAIGVMAAGALLVRAAGRRIGW